MIWAKYKKIFTKKKKIVLDTLIADTNKYYLNRLENIVELHPSLNLIFKSSEKKETIKNIFKLNPDLIIIDDEIYKTADKNLFCNSKTKPSIIICSGTFYSENNTRQNNYIFLKPILKEEIIEAVNKIIKKKSSNN
ncbi:MAG TPA: hypothetical protein VKN74_03290 [Candidatus Mcinerneyibacterium sp.]|nr:hypothetical protein [Candidatus Mcinerneyibacterium sp.]